MRVLEVASEAVPFAKTGGLADGAEVANHNIWVIGPRPLLLLVEEHVHDPEIAHFAAAAGDHGGPEAVAVEIDLAVGEADLAGVDVIGLQLRPDGRVEVGAMRAGEGGVFGDLHLGIRRTD